MKEYNYIMLSFFVLVGAFLYMLATNYEEPHTINTAKFEVYYPNRIDTMCIEYQEGDDVYITSDRGTNYLNKNHKTILETTAIIRKIYE